MNFKEFLLTENKIPATPNISAMRLERFIPIIWNEHLNFKGRFSLKGELENINPIIDTTLPMLDQANDMITFITKQNEHDKDETKATRLGEISKKLKNNKLEQADMDYLKQEFETLKYSLKDFNDLDDEFKNNIISELTKYLKGSDRQELMHLSSSSANQKVQVSKKWKHWRTLCLQEGEKPKNQRGMAGKTNFITKDINRKFAFCKSDGTLHSFGGPEETTATFFAASEHITRNGGLPESKLKGLQQTIQKHVQEMGKQLDKFKISSPIGEIDDKLNSFEIMISKEHDMKKRKALTKQRDKLRKDKEKLEAMRDKGQNLLNAILREISELEDFTTYYLFEALTGSAKFGLLGDEMDGSEDNFSNIGIPNTLMVTDGETGETQVDELDFEYCQRYVQSKEGKLTFAFKTRKVGKQWEAQPSSTIRQTLKPGDVPQNILSPLGEDDTINENVNFNQLFEELLEENYLCESFVDFAKKLVEWGKELWKRIKEIIQRGADDLIEFFGFQLDVSINKTELKPV